MRPIGDGPWTRDVHPAGFSVEWKPISRRRAKELLGERPVPRVGYEKIVGQDHDHSYLVVNVSGKLELRRFGRRDTARLSNPAFFATADDAIDFAKNWNKSPEGRHRKLYVFGPDPRDGTYATEGIAYLGHGSSKQVVWTPRGVKMPNRPRRTKRRMRLLKHMRFFREHGGGIVGRAAAGALDSAKAEAYAERMGWTYEYYPEEERYEHVYGMPDPGGDWVTVVLKSRKGAVLASLGFVDANDSDYLRVVRAELASEAMHGR